MFSVYPCLFFGADDGKLSVGRGGRRGWVGVHGKIAPRRLTCIQQVSNEIDTCLHFSLWPRQPRFESWSRQRCCGSLMRHCQTHFSCASGATTLCCYTNTFIIIIIIITPLDSCYIVACIVMNDVVIGQCSLTLNYIRDSILNSFITTVGIYCWCKFDCTLCYVSDFFSVLNSYSFLVFLFSILYCMLSVSLYSCCLRCEKNFIIVSHRDSWPEVPNL